MLRLNYMFKFSSICIWFSMLGINFKILCLQINAKGAFIYIYYILAGKCVLLFFVQKVRHLKKSGRCHLFLNCARDLFWNISAFVLACVRTCLLLPPSMPLQPLFLLLAIKTSGNQKTSRKNLCHKPSMEYSLGSKKQNQKRDPAERERNW